MTGVKRCFGDGVEIYRAYHDDEWGRPVVDERGLLEKLCLEGFQSGLSWLTILRKREAFRRAFAEFEAEAVAGFGSADVERLLADASIVRHRLKIEAAVANARATVELRKAGRSLVEMIWSHRPPPRPAPRSWADVKPETPESRALAKELKQLGFRFVGPTTVYSTMEACGLVNDHLADCLVRDEVEAEQSRVAIPPARP
ncbi:MAG: DNA-3-methyladenine glycosylase I [Gaiellaceae bacterium]